MKITDRDKKLLLGIFLILVCALYYQFFFTPQNAKLTELKQQMDRLRYKELSLLIRNWKMKRKKY